MPVLRRSAGAAAQIGRRSISGGALRCARISGPPDRTSEHLREGQQATVLELPAEPKTIPEAAALRQIVRLPDAGVGTTTVMPELVEAAATMPLSEPERTAEAVRRALPELLKLDRYERHAAALRERSFRIVLNKKTGAQAVVV
jgi:hypothetical protein